MKRLFSVAGAVGLLASFSLYGAQTYAARPAAQTMVVQLCSSAPIGVPGDAHLVRGLFNGVELATTRWRPKFRKVGLQLLAPSELNDGKADGSAVDPDREASNARTCLDNPNAMGYIGTLNSSMAQVSEPILNKGGMVMISPSNSNPILTSPVARSTYEPFTASGRLKFPTYYRVVTTDNLQGPAGATYMAKSLGVKKLYVVDDGQTYGVGLAAKMTAFNTSGHLGMQIVGTGRVNTSSASAIATTASAVAQRIASTKPDAVYCGCDEPNSYPVLRDARRDGWKGHYVGGDAIYDPSWFSFVGTTQAADTSATFFAPAYSAIPASFRNAYHKQFPKFVPGPYDGLAYDASNIALQAIYKAWKQHKLTKSESLLQRRASILPYVRHVKWFGTTGVTTFDKNGDTSNFTLSIFKTAVSGSTGTWKFIQKVSGLPSYLRPTP